MRRVRQDPRDVIAIVPTSHLPFRARRRVMEIRSLDGTEPFTTKDGSTIRELHHTAVQSLAEASLPAGARHRAPLPRASRRRSTSCSSGEGELEIDGERADGRARRRGADPAPAPGTRSPRATDLRFLCTCAPPYSHDDTYFA